MESVAQATTNALSCVWFPLSLQHIAYTRQQTGVMRERNAAS